MFVPGHHEPRDRQERRRAFRSARLRDRLQKSRSRLREPASGFPAAHRQAGPHLCGGYEISWPGWFRQGGHDGAAAGQDPFMRYVELRRHTDNEGDRLTPQGAADAEMIGRDRLHPPYAAFVSTGAACAGHIDRLAGSCGGGRWARDWWGRCSL